MRGFRASISASSTRLNAMATDRAPTIATTIQSSVQQPVGGKPPVAPRQQGSGQREGQREHGVLELDHVERQAQAFQKMGVNFYFTGRWSGHPLPYATTPVGLPVFRRNPQRSPCFFCKSSSSASGRWKALGRAYALAIIGCNRSASLDTANRMAAVSPVLCFSARRRQGRHAAHPLPAARLAASQSIAVRTQALREASSFCTVEDNSLFQTGLERRSSCPIRIR